MLTGIWIRPDPRMGPSDRERLWTGKILDGGSSGRDQGGQDACRAVHRQSNP